MSTVYIRGDACELLARARQAGPPFEDQRGDLVGIDYQEFDGSGRCNVRLTKEQATALRDALSRFLDQGATEHTIAKRESDGRIVTETWPLMFVKS